MKAGMPQEEIHITTCGVDSSPEDIEKFDWCQRLRSWEIHGAILFLRERAEKNTNPRSVQARYSQSTRHATSLMVIREGEKALSHPTT